MSTTELRLTAIRAESVPYNHSFVLWANLQIGMARSYKPTQGSTDARLQVREWLKHPTFLILILTLGCRESPRLPRCWKSKTQEIKIQAVSLRDFLRGTVQEKS